MPGDLSTILDSIGKSIDHLTESQKTLVVGHQQLLDNQVVLAEQIAGIADRFGALAESVEALQKIVITLAARE